MDSGSFPTHTATFDPPPQTSLYKLADKWSDDKLFMAVIIEELVRNGHGPVAVKLAQVLSTVPYRFVSTCLTCAV